MANIVLKSLSEWLWGFPEALHEVNTIISSFEWQSWGSEGFSAQSHTHTHTHTHTDTQTHTHRHTHTVSCEATLIWWNLPSLSPALWQEELSRNSNSTKCLREHSWAPPCICRDSTKRLNWGGNHKAAISLSHILKTGFTCVPILTCSRNPKNSQTL